jgi:hypothetical protein
LLIVGFHQHARAQTEPRVVDITVTHRFGEQIDLQAVIEYEQEIQSLQVIFSSPDDMIIHQGLVDIDPDGIVAYNLDLAQQPIRAFTEIVIYFEIELNDGSFITSDPKNYYYDDNRFDWQVQQSDAFTVYWYQDDTELGNKILDAANEGMNRIQKKFSVPVPDGIVIYAYNNIVDMQETLMFSGGSFYWIAGHAASDLGVIIVSLPPGPDQSLEIRRQIPHELTHILLYQKLGPGYTNLPRWLNEGLASISELFPNPDYQILLERAYERGALIPIQDLCTSFPIDAANFQLAYAEAYGFTSHLQQKYGDDKLEALIQSYASGMDCVQGTVPMYEHSLHKLETEWRQDEFDEDRLLNIWRDSIPLVIVFGIVFLAPVGLVVLRIGKRSRYSQ